MHINKGPYRISELLAFLNHLIELHKSFGTYGRDVELVIQEIKKELLVERSED